MEIDLTIQTDVSSKDRTLYRENRKPKECSLRPIPVAMLIRRLIQELHFGHELFG